LESKKAALAAPNPTEAGAEKLFRESVTYDFVLFKVSPKDCTVWVGLLIASVTLWEILLAVSRNESTAELAADIGVDVSAFIIYLICFIIIIHINCELQFILEKNSKKGIVLK
jgi:hypothetical protein